MVFLASGMELVENVVVGIVIPNATNPKNCVELVVQEA